MLQTVKKSPKNEMIWGIESWSFCYVNKGCLKQDTIFDWSITWLSTCWLLFEHCATFWEKHPLKLTALNNLELASGLRVPQLILLHDGILPLDPIHRVLRQTNLSDPSKAKPSLQTNLDALVTEASLTSASMSSEPNAWPFSMLFM